MPPDATPDATLSRLPRTQAVRRALRSATKPEAAADLLFLEAWEMNAPFNLATLLRAGQIRRANPALAAEIEAELKSGYPHSKNGIVPRTVL